MKATIAIGVLLIILGIFALVNDGFPYKMHESSIEIGPVELKTETKDKAKVPPALGIAAIAGGAVLIGLGFSKLRKK